MIPRSSIWGSFTKEGRIKNRWAHALVDEDQIRGLNRLRQIQQILVASPHQYLHLWIPFVESYLNVFAKKITIKDLTALEEMGGVLLVYPDRKVRPYNIWILLIKGYDNLGEERAARSLLARIYKTSSTYKRIRKQCARDLAKRGARGDQHVDIYIDFLHNVKDRRKETDIIKLLSSLCTVDFHSGNVQLKRAGEIAQRLVKSKITDVKETHLALGLHSLIIEKNPSVAAKHFHSGHKADSENKTILTGLLAACLQNSDIETIARFTEKARSFADPVIEGILSLNTTLAWLEDRNEPGSPPLLAQNIECLNLNLYAGVILDTALGRLYLLEGEAKKAAKHFEVLVEKRPKQFRWRYYACWASILCGDFDRVADHFSDAANWKGKWTIACLMLDAIPELAEQKKVYTLLDQVTSPFTSIASVRKALALTKRAPNTLEWQQGKGTFEEDLEALRTHLGFAFYMNDRASMEKAISMALFHRLPMADQIMWQGLHARLTGNIARSHALLEEAATKWEYPRAAFILAVWLMEVGRLNETDYFLSRAGRERTDPKLALLRAYIHARDDRTEKAFESLEQLIALNQPRAYYTLGNLYLTCAEKARKSGHTKQVTRYREQATGAFDKALKTKTFTLPEDCEVLVHCAAFVTVPHKETTRCSKIWRSVERLSGSHQRPWIVWNAALARIWSGSADQAAEAGEVLVTMCEASGYDKDPWQTAVAQALAKSCIESQNPESANKLVILLDRLLGTNTLTPSAHYHQCSVTATARLKYTAGTEKQRASVQQHIVRRLQMDPGNGSLAILLAQIHLNEKERNAAVSTLQDAKPENEYEQILCSLLGRLLQGQPISTETLPQPIRQEQDRACRLLGASVAFSSGELEQGYDIILSNLSEREDDMAKVVDMHRLLPLLCQYITRRKNRDISALAGVIRRLADTSLDNHQTLTVARCAAVIGENEVASRLWEIVFEEEVPCDSRLRREHIDYLCHLAAVAYRAEDLPLACDRLRMTAREVEKQSLEMTYGV